MELIFHINIVPTWTGTVINTRMISTNKGILMNNKYVRLILYNIKFQLVKWYNLQLTHK